MKRSVAQQTISSQVTSPLGITLIYLVVGVLWIMFSDQWVLRLSGSLTNATIFQTVKGILFIGATSLMLYLLIRRGGSWLQESEQRYRLLAENVQDLVCLHEPDGTYTWLSPSVERLLGYTPGELIGTSPYALFHPEDRERIREESHEPALTGNEGIRVVYRIRRNDGQYIWFETLTQPRRDKEGEIVGLQTHSRDVTERKRAEEALRRSEEKFSKAFYASPDSIILTSVPEGCILEVNKGFQQITGYDAGEVVGRTTRELELWANLEDRERMLETLQSKGQVRDLEADFRIKSGELRTCIVSGELIEVEDEKYLVSIVRDITEHKQAEEALRASEERYRTLIDTSPNGIAVTDLEGHFILINQRAVDLLGFDSADELIGMSSVGLVAPEDRSRLPERVQDALETGRGHTFEQRLLRKDGSRFPVETNGKVILDDEGTPQAFLTVFRDITERKQAEALLQQAEQRYRSLFEEAPIMYLIVRAEEGEPVIVDCNRRFTEELGYARADVIGQPLADFYTPTSRQKLLGGGYEQALAGTFKIQERELVTRSGRIIHTLLKALPEHDADGEATGTRAMYLDVTERKQAEQALRKSEERLRTLVENTPIVFFATDQDGVFTLSEGQQLERLGLEPGEVVGMSAFDVYADVPVIIEYMRRSLDGEELEWTAEVGDLVFDTYTAPLWNDGEVTGVIGVATDVTERRRAEEALRRERELLEKLFDTIPVMITMYEPRLDNFQVNKEFERVLGWSNEEVQHVDLMEVCYPDPAYRAEVAGFMQSLEPEWRDFSTTAKDGTIVESSWTNVLLSDDTQVGVGVDITERKRAEAALRASEARYRLLAENALDLIWTTDMELNFTYVSPASQPLYGYTPEEVMAQSPFDFLTPASRERAYQARQRRKDLMETGEEKAAIRNEFEQIRKDGSTFWTEVITNPLRDDEGVQVGYLGVTRDITERKQAEETLQAREQQYRELVQTTSAILWRGDPQTFQFTFVSKEAELLLGYPKERWVEEPGFWVDHMHPEDRDWAPAYCSQATEELQRHTFDYRMIASDGRIVWLRDIVNVLDEDGHPVEMVGVMIDITELKQAEEEIRRYNRELESLLEVSQRLSRNLDLDVLFSDIVEAVVEMLPHVEAASLWLIDEEEQVIVPQAWHGFDDATLEQLSVPVGASFVERVLQADGPVLVEDVARVHREVAQALGDRPPSATDDDYAMLKRIKSMVGISLLVEGNPIGVFFADSTATVAAFGQREVRLMQSLAAQAAIAIENGRLFRDVRAMSQRLLDAQEVERRRIAQELHDEVGALLTSLQLSLKMITAADAVPVDELQEAQDLVNELMEEVRELSLDLRPSMLDDLGLEPALQWYFDRFTAQTGITVDFHHEFADGRRFASEVETAAYRIVQEAVTNAARYAGADTVQVLCYQKPDQLVIHVIDEGRGFDLATVQRNESIGLAGMKERAELVGGSLAIETAPDAGTRISATLPLT